MVDVKNIRLPRVVVSLGPCIEVHFSGGRVWRPRNKRIHLCAGESGRTLWVMGVSKEHKDKQPASALFERFRAHAVRGYRNAKIRDRISKLVRLGRVDAVVYEWSKREERIHRWRKKPQAWADSANNPTFVKISGGRIRVTSRGILG